MPSMAATVKLLKPGEIVGIAWPARGTYGKANNANDSNELQDLQNAEIVSKDGECVVLGLLHFYQIRHDF